MRTDHKVLKIHSNGMGTQSICMYFMSCMGIIPRFDYSIWADTGSERKGTYDYLKWLEKWIKENKDIAIPLIKCGKKSIYRDLIRGRNSAGESFASIPAYTMRNGEQGMLQRQCTEEYKVAEVNKAIRKLYGFENNKKWLPLTKVYIGLTIEELTRISIPDSVNKWHVYPFCNYCSRKVKKINPGKKSHFLNYDVIFGKRLMTKGDCINWLLKNNFPVPPDSSCSICPFRSNAGWQDMKENAPKEFKRAVRLDYAIRNSTKMGVDEPVFLHKSCKPLDKVNFTKDQETINFECSGNCHV